MGPEIAVQKAAKRGLRGAECPLVASEEARSR